MLLEQKLPHLRAVAAARGLTGRGGQRETLVPALVESLLDPAAQAAVIGALDQPARAVLALARVLDWSREPLTAASLRRVLRAGTAVSGELDGALLTLADLGPCCRRPWR